MTLVGLSAGHIQGIKSTSDEILLRGKSIRAEVSDALNDRVELVRSMEGASTLKIPIEDSEREVRRSKLLLSRFDVELDDLWFRFTAADAAGKALNLTFEERIVAWLRTGKGDPTHIERGKATRAEFCVSQVREIPQRVDIVCPELHTVQPIEDVKQGREASLSVNEQRGKGLDSGANLTVKGVKATSGQIDVGDRMLRTAASLNAPRAATIALMAAGIVESLLQKVTPNLLELIPSTAAQAGVNPSDVEAVTKSFLTDGYAVGKSAGAIAVSQRDSNPAHIAQAVQNSGAGASTNGEGNYGPWVKEATEWVDAFGGGSTSSSSLTVTSDKPYQFERKASETRWDSIGRLMEEVKWRRFVSAGLLYLIAETDLLASRVRWRVAHEAPGVNEITWNWDQGRKVNEVMVSANVSNLAAPPGSVAVVSGEGPADGKYLVSSITTRLGSPLADISLKRRTVPLPEPAPETTSKTIDLGAGRNPSRRGGADGDLVSWARAQLGTDEGSSKQEEWAAALGVSASEPWCSIFVAAGIKAALGLPLPPNADYSGAWTSWSHGQKVSLSQIQPGDLPIFDWGDGGITDHVAIYVGGGKVIGGNQSNSVTEVPMQSSAVVGVVRPNG